MTCTQRPTDDGAFYPEKNNLKGKYIIQAYGCWCIVVMGTRNSRRLRMKTWTKTLFAVVLGAALAGAAAADTLELRDGRVLQGKYLGGTQATLRFEVNGEVQAFSTNDVV